MDGYKSELCDLESPFFQNTLRMTNLKGGIGCQNTKFKVKLKCWNFLWDQLEMLTSLQKWTQQETGREVAQIEKKSSEHSKTEIQMEESQPCDFEIS